MSGSRISIAKVGTPLGAGAGWVDITPSFVTHMERDARSRTAERETADVEESTTDG